MDEKRRKSCRLCSLCGKPIGQGRLEALRGVTTCIECAKRHPVRKIEARELDLSQASPIDRTGFAPAISKVHGLHINRRLLGRDSSPNTVEVNREARLSVA